MTDRIDNRHVKSGRDHLTAKQIAAGSLKGKFLVRLDEKTVIYIRDKARAKEIKAKYEKQ